MIYVSTFGEGGIIHQFRTNVQSTDDPKLPDTLYNCPSEEKTPFAFPSDLSAATISPPNVDTLHQLPIICNLHVNQAPHHMQPARQSSSPSYATCTSIKLPLHPHPSLSDLCSRVGVHLHLKSANHLLMPLQQPHHPLNHRTACKE